MKFFAVFAAVLALAVGYPPSVTYSLNELSEAIQDPNTDPILVPFLEDALNEMMAILMLGEHIEYITVAMPIVATYNLEQLSAAIKDPNTHPAHIPYLEKALNEMMQNLFAGIQQEAITVVIPADLPMPDDIPASPVAVAPAPVEVPAAASSSPLVQIVVNIQQKDQYQVPVVDPVIVEDAPMPIEIVEDAPMPIEIVDEAPMPIEIVDEAPMPIEVVESPFPVNPIDEINPGGIAVNPIDPNQ